jgi:hypothetical protein
VHFPDYYDIDKFTFEVKHFPVNYSTGEKVNVSWYFPAYSASCIPISILLSILKLNQSYAFALTNAFLLIAALLAVYKFLKNVTEKTRFFLIMALGINPIVYYVPWASAEVFIYAFIVGSLVFFFNKSYKISAVLLTVAGSMNITVMALGILMIVVFFIDMYAASGKQDNIFKIVYTERWRVLKYAASFCCIIPSFFYNYLATAGGSFLSPQGGAIANYGSIGLLLSRWLMYLFDLNFGLLPWFAIVFILYIFVIIISAAVREYRFPLLALGHFLVIMGFSLALHINCGMNGIARYNAWSAPMMLFVTIIFIFDKHESNKKLKHFINVKTDKLATVAISLSVLLTATMIYRFGIGSYVEMLPSSKLVLNNAPALYNPLYSTFISRIEHRDGGYDYREPVYYEDSKRFNEIRKILVRRSEKDSVTDALAFLDDESRAYFMSRLSEISEYGNEYVYLNIPRKYKITKNPYVKDIDYSLNLIFHDTAIYNDAVIFLPVTIKPETYYKVECDIDAAADIIFDADFFGGSAYDLSESECTLQTSLALPQNQRYGYLYSANSLLADNGYPYLRFLNMSLYTKNGDFPSISNIKLYEMVPK